MTSLSEGIRSGLLINNETNKLRIQQSLDLPTVSLDMATGITGQGVAALQCAAYIDNHFTEQLLQRIINTLLNAQNSDGSWLLTDTPGEKTGKKKISFGYGIGGITWFLLEYMKHYPDARVQAAALKALGWLLKTTQQLKGLFKPAVFNKIIKEERERGDERKGIILTFIKAYEILMDIRYKYVAKEALQTYPCYAVKNNFSLDSGMAGLGELYLEAFRVFNNEEWQQRSDWLAGVYQHTAFSNMDGSIYWKMDEYDEPTADLMVGNSGIIHFLIRCISPDKLGYRILN